MPTLCNNLNYSPLYEMKITVSFYKILFKIFKKHFMCFSLALLFLMLLAYCSKFVCCDINKFFFQILWGKTKSWHLLLKMNINFVTNKENYCKYKQLIYRSKEICWYSRDVIPV